MHAPATPALHACSMIPSSPSMHATCPPLSPSMHAPRPPPCTHASTSHPLELVHVLLVLGHVDDELGDGLLADLEVILKLCDAT